MGAIKEVKETCWKKEKPLHILRIFMFFNSFLRILNWFPVEIKFWRLVFSLQMCFVPPIRMSKMNFPRTTSGMGSHGRHLTSSSPFTTAHFQPWDLCPPNLPTPLFQISSWVICPSFFQWLRQFRCQKTQNASEVQLASETGNGSDIGVRNGVPSHSRGTHSRKGGLLTISVPLALEWRGCEGAGWDCAAFSGAFHALKLLGSVAQRSYTLHTVKTGPCASQFSLLCFILLLLFLPVALLCTFREHEGRGQSESQSLGTTSSLRTVVVVLNRIFAAMISRPSGCVRPQTCTWIWGQCDFLPWPLTRHSSVLCAWTEAHVWGMHRVLRERSVYGEGRTDSKW